MFEHLRAGTGMEPGGMAQWLERLPPTSTVGSLPDAARCMWVKLLFGFSLTPKVFLSGFSGFPFSTKSNITKLQFHQHENQIS